MSNEQEKKKIIGILHKVFYLILAIYILSLFIREPIIPRKASLAFIGFVFSGIGLLGYFENSILLTRSKPLEYAEGSSTGKTINIIISVFGILIFLIGLVVLIIS